MANHELDDDWVAEALAQAFFDSDPAFADPPDAVATSPTTAPEPIPAAVEPVIDLANDELIDLDRSSTTPADAALDVAFDEVRADVTVEPSADSGAQIWAPRAMNAPPAPPTSPSAPPISPRPTPFPAATPTQVPSAPSSPAPTTDAPVPVVEPTTVRAPVVEPPAVEPPVVEAPVVEAPVVEAPLVEAPLVEAPVVEAPVVEPPRVEAPVTESDVDHAPAESLVADDDPDEGGNRALRGLIEWLVVLVGAVVVALLLRAFLIHAYWIPSESMEATLQEQDRVLVNKLSYRLHDVHRGDVVVFRRPDEEEAEIRDLIKRVIALEGETVEARDNQIFIDGRALTEPYLAPDEVIDPFGPTTVPDGHVFVMGDNRDESYDSRFFGTVDEGRIEGRAFVLFWPLNRVGTL